METGKKNLDPTLRHQRNREEYQPNADGKGEQVSRQVCTRLFDVDEKPTLQILQALELSVPLLGNNNQHLTTNY